jgi:Leucine-rich repeat (LRR) protein
LIILQELDLSINQLGGHIVTELGNFSSLDMVDISHNKFSGLFPPSICMGNVLRDVIAEYNRFTGIHHQTFQNCTSLQTVVFTANNIVADIRDIFGEHQRQLLMIAFSQNQLYGTLLTDEGEIFFCNYTSLDLIDLSNNALHGGLSKCFWDIPSLGFMDLSNNSFDGVVPLSRSFPYSLEYLRLANNHFKGPFPLALKKCKNLTTLDLGGNNFSGTIPSWISKDLPGLRFFRLSSNMFDGIIPRQILQFSRLQLLDLSKNKLTGAIPDDFLNFTGMAYEQNDDSGYHQFPGKIQIVWKNVDYVYITKIAGMVGIDLSGNVLSQEIPGGLTTLLVLRYLNLSGNHLSGCIPEDIGNLVLLESLDLSL